MASPQPARFATSGISASSPMERVEAWTVSQAADALAAASRDAASPPAREARGTTVAIDIPLDESVRQAPPPPRPRPEAVHTVYKRREPITRDSQKRREALLKGKEGSRRRQRWENDRLLSNPYAQPPLPSDWQVQPTYTRQTVPYFLAPLWDAEYARKTQERQRRAEAARKPASKQEAEAQKVARELKAKLKKSRGATGLLQDLEEDVRDFIEKWEQREKELEKDGLIEADSEDDEIVFVGRNGAMSDERRREKREQTLENDKLIFQSLVHDGAFGCVFVHCTRGVVMLTDRQPVSCACHRRLLRLEHVLGHCGQPTTARSLRWSKDGSNYAASKSTRVTSSLVDASRWLSNLVSPCQYAIRAGLVCRCIDTDTVRNITSANRTFSGYSGSHRKSMAFSSAVAGA